VFAVRHFISLDFTSPRQRHVNEENHGDVQREVGLTVSEVELIEAGPLPKTTSGKLQRSATRDRYLGGTLGLVRRRTDASAVA